MGRLRFTEEQPVFWLDAKGFGIGFLLGRGIPLYAADSVVLLLAHLAQSYRSNMSYLEGIKAVAGECAHAYRTGIITSVNITTTMYQERLALTYVKEHCVRRV